MSVLLRQRLKYALSGQEVKKICNDKELNIKVDGKARRDHRYPLGLMDVVEIVKTGEHFRMLYDLKGRYTPVRIDSKEASFKLCKVKNKVLGKNKIPYIVTHDGRTIRFPHPDIKKNDTVKVSVVLSFSNSLRKTIILIDAFSLTCSPVKSRASLNSRTSPLSSSLAETTSVV
jgi:small subunit ribosomal protein S4e